MKTGNRPSTIKERPLPRVWSELSVIGHRDLGQAYEGTSVLRLIAFQQGSDRKLEIRLDDPPELHNNCTPLSRR